MTQAMNGHHALHQSASFSATIRVQLENHPGAFAALAGAIAGPRACSAPSTSSASRRITRSATWRCWRPTPRISSAFWPPSAAPRVELVHWSDRTFLLHLGGKLEVRPRCR